MRKIRWKLRNDIYVKKKKQRARNLLEIFNWKGRRDSGLTQNIKKKIVQTAKASGIVMISIIMWFTS